MTLSIQEPRKDNELFMVHSCHLAKNGEQTNLKGNFFHVYNSKFKYSIKILNKTLIYVSNNYSKNFF